jgi:hypothetical protein
MWKLFKRKPKEVEKETIVVKMQREEVEAKEVNVAKEYISHLRSVGFNDEQIRQKFKENNYPLDESLLELNNTQEVKMVKEVVAEDEEYADEDEDGQSEDDEEVEAEEEVEEVVRPKKKKVEVKKVEEVKQVPQSEVTMADVITDLQTLAQELGAANQRIATLEAKLFRMLSA